MLRLIVTDIVEREHETQVVCHGEPFRAEKEGEPNAKNKIYAGSAKNSTATFFCRTSEIEKLELKKGDVLKVEKE